MGAVTVPVEQLVTAVYVSSATTSMEDEQILDILRLARAKNEKLNVTGMLLYREGNFLQVLEGPPPAVDLLINSIKKDPRHKGLILISRKPIEERQFADWRMAFRDLNKSAAGEDGYSAFLDLDFPEEETGEQSQLVYRMLRRFKQTMR